MEKIADVAVPKLPDYDKEIEVRVTLGELMVIKATLGDTCTDDNASASRESYGDEFAEKVSQEDLGFKVFQSALKILREEGI